MQWWQILLMIAAVAAAALAAYWAGKERGERIAGEEHDGGRKTVGGESLLGSGESKRSVEEAFMRALPQAVALTDGNGAIRYARDDIEQYGCVASGHIRNDDMLDMLAQVEHDGVSRERELEVTRPAADLERGSSGRGVRAGQAAPSRERYLSVRVSGIGDGLFALFITDVSERRHFEEMRREFMTNVAHELKTPAGAISLLAETISDASDDPDAVRYFSGRVSKESARLTELVQKLIDLQKMQDAGHGLQPKRLSALAVARAAIDANRVQADRRHIDLVLAYGGTQLGLEPAGDDPDVWIECDENAIVTAVKNLVENAIHYSPEHTTVRVVVSEDAGNVHIRVIDQGIGIPEASIGHIFERFYRVDPARSRQTGGTGLGLAITKHCVEDCGGTISVWSHESEGSTFTIELPCAGDAGSVANASSANDADSTNDADNTGDAATGQTA
ncbi:two-component system sensor histidine kinase [Bifidobacterium sp. DSM 109960]|uniref:Sensor-like histidine kinase SenX3 n=1 Tax=Bifidobacterium erythrocebi TaxID=2675325 RepID=A0A7Y0ESA0_9BIFI|nr:ATP-binding protein [Bifidobacterium sp. DSM 109960]NMM95497.1 two-component system sensor histidine kinase [Bifidobacterium sp. DSM 109960]